ncbi:MAG: hypothetical protein WC289_02975 [Patescibacteria group bacterium]|jgi:hypothetical protein
MLKKILIFSALGLLGFASMQIPFSYVIGGQNQHFSLFDFMAPSFGGFVGSIWGALAVIAVKFFNVLAHGATFDTTTIIRLFPLAAGALYFGLKKYKAVAAVIPLVSMVFFIMHPEGRQAWYYSLYWLIPVAAVFAKKSLVLNSLGATFTAHAVGGVAFLYAFNLPAEVWIALIPVVFVERMLFTAGVALISLSTNTALAWLARVRGMQFVSPLVRAEYVASREFLRRNL